MHVLLFHSLLSFQLSSSTEIPQTTVLPVQKCSGTQESALESVETVTGDAVQSDIFTLKREGEKGRKPISMESAYTCQYGHGDDDDDEDLDVSKWAMEVIDAVLERAFRPPPKVSFMDRYLHHQYILLETDVDEAGQAPETVTEDLFPGNPNPLHTFSLEGTISAEKKRPVKRWSMWDSTLEKERQLYISTDSLNKRLMEQYWQQGRVMPVFRDERLKCKMYPMFVRDDVSKQEMHLNFDQEIE